MIYSANVSLSRPVTGQLSDEELKSMSIVERSTWLDLRHETMANIQAISGGNSMNQLVPTANPFKSDVPVQRAPTAAVEAFGAAPEDTILRIKKNFGGERVYTYALVKAGGKWYATGQVHAGKGLSAEKVFEFLTQGTLVSVELARSFETIEV